MSTIAALFGNDGNQMHEVELPHASHDGQRFNGNSSDVPKFIEIQSADSPSKIYRRRKTWRDDGVPIGYDLVWTKLVIRK